MTPEQEKDFWLRMITDLNEKFTLHYLAQEFGVSERQVSNWKCGDRPKGFTAIKVYLFHAKHRTRVQEDRTLVHVQTTGARLVS
jgi:hypothetical protein